MLNLHPVSAKFSDAMDQPCIECISCPDRAYRFNGRSGENMSLLFADELNPFFILCIKKYLAPDSRTFSNDLSPVRVPKICMEILIRTPYDIGK